MLSLRTDSDFIFIARLNLTWRLKEVTKPATRISTMDRPGGVPLASKDPTTAPLVTARMDKQLITSQMMKSTTGMTYHRVLVGATVINSAIPNKPSVNAFRKQH